MDTSVGGKTVETLRALPGDAARQVMWRFTNRPDLQQLVQAARAVARGPVARLVADGERNNHEWTPSKAALLTEFDRAGLTAAYLDPDDGGSVPGPRNLALALMAFELAWVDAGAATGNLAQHLALAHIRLRGTPSQRRHYSRAAAGVDGQPPRRGAFVLTEPIPYAGVETGLLSGKVRIAEWPEGGEPVLEVEKRGRFITSMGFADFVVAAVDSADTRLSGSCMIILEKEDPGTFDRGTPTRKLVHQLWPTRDPHLHLRVPASRIVGGYSVRDGVIVPSFTHGEIAEAVFRHTRVTVSLMTPAKLLSAVEPILRYQRSRFRGGESTTPGTPRYERGLQQKQDALHRVLDVWATGEAAAALGFWAARVFDELDVLEARKNVIFAERGIAGPKSEFKALHQVDAQAIAYLTELSKPAAKRNVAKLEALGADDLVRYAVTDAMASVACPASKLWNTGFGANMMREAVSLMGGYGITEDCPGFLAQKWIDAQLEATYEGPEAVQRRHLSSSMTNEVFLAQFATWVNEMREIAADRPGSGACALASAMELWLWTLRHMRRSADADGQKLYQGSRQGVTFPLADALCWLLASRQQILDTLALEAAGREQPGTVPDLPGLVTFMTDLCHVQAARAAGEVARTAAELVFGYNRHPAWDDPKCVSCVRAAELEELEQLIPGIESTSGSYLDVIGADGSHRTKAGPCVRFVGLDEFTRLRDRLDGCLTGARLAKDRAAEALTRVAIPDVLDYPR